MELYLILSNSNLIYAGEAVGVTNGVRILIVRMDIWLH